MLTSVACLVVGRKESRHTHPGKAVFFVVGASASVCLAFSAAKSYLSASVTRDVGEMTHLNDIITSKSLGNKIPLFKSLQSIR